MYEKLKPVIENIYKRAEAAARKPVPGEKGKPVQDDPGVEMHFKAPKNVDRQKVLKKVKESIFSKMGKTDPDSISQAGGDAGAYAKIKQQKDAEFKKNTAPVHYQTDSKGGQSTRRDLRAGPKGHSRANTFEKKGKRYAQADNFAKGDRTAPMSQKAIHGSGVRGKTVTKDGQNIPSERWSSLKQALSNRKLAKASSTVPEGAK